MLEQFSPLFARESEFVYLEVILDANSRRVVGWALDTHNWRCYKGWPAGSWAVQSNLTVRSYVTTRFLIASLWFIYKVLNPVAPLRPFFVTTFTRPYSCLPHMRREHIPPITPYF
jgi:hypothetical protein